jgi:Tfp pilus assembly protein FimT
MTSILKVDTIQDADGNNIINESSNTITIGASGDTTNIVGTLQNNGASVGGANTPVFSAKVGSTQTVSNNSFTKIAFDTEEKDSDGAFDTSSYRFTVPSGKAGTYMLGMIMYTNPNNDQLVESYAMIYKNGSSLVSNNIFYGSSARPDSDVQVVNTVVDLAVSDYIEGYVYSLCASSSSTRLFAGLNNAIFGYKIIT